MNYTKKQLREAKEIREQRIRYLQLCTCAYPVVSYRNRSGHDDECPSHVAYLAAREAGDES